MPRKKIILDSEVKESPIITKKEFKEYKARMIVNSRIYAKDDTSSYLVGVAMIGETITVLEPSISKDHMAKIRTDITNRTGYVDPKSFV